MTATTLRPVAAAEELADTVSALADRAEADRTLPAELVGKLRDGGLFAMGLPASLGGLECRPEELIPAIETVSRADASVGWSVLIGNTSAFLAWLPPGTAEEIVATNPCPIVAGSMAPVGRGELMADGTAYRVTGRWPFSSGCSHADVLMGGFVVRENGRPKLDENGRPGMRVAFFAADEVTVHDTWHVAGLAGTGSHDIAVSEVVVPVRRTAVPFAEPSHQPGPLYRLSPYNVLMVLFAGFPLGVAGRALDELAALATTKQRVGARHTLLDDPLVNTELVADHAALRAARAGVLDAAADVWDTVESGRELGLRQRAGLAAATVHAFDVARGIVSRAFHQAGASALFDHSPLQRCLRDMHAAGQHIAFSADSRERLSRAWLGLPVPPAIFQV
ncbi:acyl-CoA dehydrogenase family protein [Micromonospora carbonacea]|uniref:Acyl-CoA dehydrogenase n=1 Tax=Micromonospora carbonacea TaxID=47853 RepID=A0A1C4VF60_9ACTN|nr:acyl-CoA dehydrogenase family protein [Micromonospora carbonacea]MBB5825931.1 alkylation response protein AidB-like acyl-CoA dehydrogenase [Micromonospora carbonacea]QLD25523.1 acyl-CoA dehydrogenase family protein [Micromonospora carbonacea]SCE82335.1 Acyl-CoA dehydrogenase [Micromonospora carbonacea]